MIDVKSNRPRARSFSKAIALLLVTAVAVVLLVTVLAGVAGAMTYSSDEVAFVSLINQYREAQGLPGLLVSDAISDASNKHSADMARYGFFDHTSLHSDYFPIGSAPWDRMRLCGYSYNTSMGENIAAGQSTAAQVFAAWQASPGHNANMLNSTYAVVGVSFYTLSGSPYTYYWTTDFGGYVDPTAHAVGAAPAPTATRYQQTDPHLVYSGTWVKFLTSGASGGSYKRANVGSASVTVTFTGTYLDWVATAGTTLSKAYVSLDGGAAQSVDLARSAVAYQQKVWNTGTLASGKHTVKIWRDPSDATGKYISVDAVDVTGTLN
jgi:uncharacterized protein YkwD